MTMTNLSLFIEIILLLFAILAFNGIIYSLTLFKLNEQNSSENIPVTTKEKNVLTPTLLLASNHLRLTSGDSSASETLSETSGDSSASETLYETSSETLSETSNETNLSETFYEILPEDRFSHFDLTEEDMRLLYDPYIISPNNLEIEG
jgi:hypothetical protein